MRLLRVSVPRLVDGTGSPPVRDAAVLVRDGVIVQVGEEQQVARPSEARTVRFGGGATAVPGLIDAHVHVSFDPASHDPYPSTRASTEILLRRCRQLLEAGVTTVRDCGSTLEAGLALRAATEADPTVGCRVVPCGPPVTPRGGHCSFLGGETEQTEEAARRRAHELATAGVGAVKLMATGGLLTPSTDAAAATFPQSFMTALVEEAHRHGLPVTAHAHAVEGMARAVTAGVDSLEHASMLGHDGSATFHAGLAASMHTHGVRCVSTLTAGTDPGSRERFADRTPPSVLEAVSRANRISNFTRLREHGVTIVAGTDVGTPATDFSRQLVLELQALVETGMTAREALQAATSEAAEHLGLSGTTGTLVAGKDADILITREDPSTDVGRLASVVGLVRQGVPVAPPDQDSPGTPRRPGADHRNVGT